MSVPVNPAPTAAPRDIIATSEPLARARSDRGYQAAIVRVATGKAPACASPTTIQIPHRSGNQVTVPNIATAMDQAQAKQGRLILAPNRSPSRDDGICARA